MCPREGEREPGAYKKAHTGLGDKHTRAGSRDKFSYRGCSRVCVRLPSDQKRRAGENIEANDSARSPKFLAPASWPDRNCRLSERPDESRAAVKVAEIREGAS